LIVLYTDRHRHLPTPPSPINPHDSTFDSIAEAGNRVFDLSVGFLISFALLQHNDFVASCMGI